MTQSNNNKQRCSVCSERKETKRFTQRHVGLASLVDRKHGAKKRNGKSGAGFTLPELLVSIAVFVILASVVLANFRQGGYSDDLRATADELVANIRRVQNLAVAGALVRYDTNGKSISNTNRDREDPPTGEQVPAGGYGISINWIENYYTMFADFATCGESTPWTCVEDVVVNPCTFYDEPNDANFRNDRYCDQIIETATIQLRPKVRISYIQTIGNTKGASFLEPIDIIFQAPRPVPRIQGRLDLDIKIGLQHTLSRQCRMVSVDTDTGAVSQELVSACEESLP